MIDERILINDPVDEQPANVGSSVLIYLLLRFRDGRRGSPGFRGFLGPRLEANFRNWSVIFRAACAPRRVIDDRSFCRSFCGNGGFVPGRITRAREQRRTIRPLFLNYKLQRFAAAVTRRRVDFPS